MRVSSFICFSILAPLLTMARQFVHPGYHVLMLNGSILHTQADLDRMKFGVANKLDPWYPAFLNMSRDPLASASYKMRGPLTFATRNGTGSSPGKTAISNDAVASLLNALMLASPALGNITHAQKSTQILSGWANTLQLLNGTDAQLTAGLYGPQFVNAAEIMRSSYPAWPQSEIETFKTMILNIFYPPASQTTPTALQRYPFDANWGSAGEKAIVAFGAFLDNETIHVSLSTFTIRYDEGLSLYLNFPCSNLNNTINSFGQNCESGRDQGHTQLGLGNMAELCQVAYNQGDRKYWDLLNDRLMVGYEYTAKYNLGYNVSYDPDFYRCDANLVGGPWANISSTGRGQLRSIYQIAYAHYVQLKGKRMPWTKRKLEQTGFETNDTVNNVGDTTPYGTLRFSLFEAKWYPLGCYTDSVAARSLPVRTDVRGGWQAMTSELCQSACQAAGYTYAGTEYSGECYCANEIMNGSVPAPDGNALCNMTCYGNSTEICGGPNRLSLFVFGAPSFTSASNATATSNNVTASKTATLPGWTPLECYTNSTSDEH
ncbi:GPI anchored protein [Rutstroemia sp. NJR-2017a WRK4]|nr:GPI anchored protein [Rutstroemia sp. NJR-2017a WRK4]